MPKDRAPANPFFSRTTGHPDYINRDDILGPIHDAFVVFDPAFDSKRGPLQTRFKCLRKKLDRMQAAGAAMHCAAQVALEIKWLINYTADFPRVGTLLDRLEALCAVPDSTPLQQAPDGSWGGCCTEFYRKLEPTVDALQTRSVLQTPPRPLAFMKRMQDAEFVLSYLYGLQITDIAKTGRNHRDELSAVQSALSQIIFKDEIRSVLEDSAFDFVVSERLEEVYGDFVRQTQHPRTGYWGPWYRFGDRLVMQQDLSFTFHQVHYRRGNVEGWEQIVDTTLAIKELIYPAGWRPSAEQEFKNHNNYDVAQIFSYGWPHMRRDQKRAAGDAVLKMLDWCLSKSIDGDHFVEDKGIDGFYFGVRFLEVVGFWDNAKRFWWRRGLTLPKQPSPYELALRLEQGFFPLRDGSEMAETISEILRRARLINTPVVA